MLTALNLISIIPSIYPLPPPLLISKTNQLGTERLIRSFMVFIKIYPKKLFVTIKKSATKEKVYFLLVFATVASLAARIVSSLGRLYASIELETALRFEFYFSLQRKFLKRFN